MIAPNEMRMISSMPEETANVKMTISILPSREMIIFHYFAK
jgi:hypothetical protein